MAYINATQVESKQRPRRDPIEYQRAEVRGRAPVLEQLVSTQHLRRDSDCEAIPPKTVLV
jgi:hypothetical protein